MAFSDPENNLNELGLHEGSFVADLGAGSGVYTLVAARQVGAAGKVFAIDVQADLLARIKNAAHNAHLTNVTVVHGDIEEPGGTRLKENSIDVALVCNVLFQTEQKANVITEIKRILKNMGRVLVIDWTESFGGFGPQPEYVVTDTQVKALFEKQHFNVVREFDAGDHHYGLIFAKK